MKTLITGGKDEMPYLKCMTISVIIASKGRPQILTATVDSLLRQARRPDEIIIAVSGPQDYEPELSQQELVRVLISPPGSAAQRNFGLRHANPQADLVVFFDDDVELGSEYLIKISNYMAVSADVASLAITPTMDRPDEGRMTHAEARDVLEATPVKSCTPFESRGASGFSMIFRGEYARQEEFDENLVGYGLGEDQDYANRMLKYGKIMAYQGGRIIHLATTSGRVPQIKLGYAQVMNLAYLHFVKKTINRREWWRFGPPVIAVNILGAAGLLDHIRRRPDAHFINRSERARGNLLAIRDILLHGIDPKRVQNIKL